MEPRKNDILKAVVEEFTLSAVPVGSQSLARGRFINLSSATIRNELAELAELGYLAQRHTSAGRIPTDRGYRYFVDFLMSRESIPAPVLAYIDEEMRSVPLEAQALAEKVANTVATVTRNAAIATTPRGALARIKHVDFVSLEPQDVLMVLLVDGNIIRQQVLRLDQIADQGELTRIANRINSDFDGRNAEDVAASAAGRPQGLEREIMIRLAEALELLGRGVETLVVHDGVRNLLQQPEFAEAARLGEVLEVLEESSYLSSLLLELVGDSDLQIVIGSENSTMQLRSCTVILTTYGPSRRVKGVLGVVGPTRMDYGQIVGRLQSVAHLASERMAEAHPGSGF